MRNIVFLNGSFIPLAEAKISVADYGFLFGYGLFETMRAYNSKVFRLERHLNRLEKSAAELGIPLDLCALKNAVEDTIRMNGLKEARVRLTVSIGKGSPVPDIKTCAKPTVLIMAVKYIPYSPEIYAKGFKCIVSSIVRNSQSPISKMKTANYLDSLLARQEARRAGNDDALLINEKGFLAEASSSNLFLVSQNVIKTPGENNGILPGMTREAVLELAGQLGIQVREMNLSLSDLLSAEEAFVTNSMIEVMPLTYVGNRPLHSGRCGVITGKIMKAYQDLVLKETN